MRRAFLAFLALVVASSLLTGCGGKATNINAKKNVNASSIGSETNANASTNVGNTDISVNAEKEVTYVGKVFVKGYNTPSESYGILTTTGEEIGLEAYNTMKEQFRPYIGDRVSVTFSTICLSSKGNCCRTTFHNCGTVKSWEPVKANK